MQYLESLAPERGHEAALGECPAHGEGDQASQWPRDPMNQPPGAKDRVARIVEREQQVAPRAQHAAELPERDADVPLVCEVVERGRGQHDVERIRAEGEGPHVRHTADRSPPPPKQLTKRLGQGEWRHVHQHRARPVEDTH